MKSLAALVVAAFLVSACGGASSGLRIEKLGGGVYKLHCDAALSACLQRADTLCRNASFDVLRAQDHRDRLGGEVGSSNVENRSSIAHIRCTTTGRPLLPWEDEDDDTQWKLGPRREAPPPVAVTPADERPLLAPAQPEPAQSAQSGATVAPPSRALPASSKPAAGTGAACVPGATQTCIGPAACNGGQSCLADGSGFGPCDCGTQAPQPLKSPKPALP
jgi:hypothetical protein